MTTAEKEPLVPAKSETDQKILSELSVKKIQLHWLLQISKAINYNLPSDQIFKIYQDVLLNQLGVGKLALFVHEKKWLKCLELGCSIPFDTIDLGTDLAHVDLLHQGKKNSPSWFRQFDTIIPVYHNSRLLAYAFVGDIKCDEHSRSRDILPYIHTLTNIIVVAIENKKLNKELIRQAAMDRELELAANMQNMLFPQFLPSDEYFELAATYIPHHQVGGDYYDFISINRNESVLCMADVSGKGMAAALLMSNFQANLHALVKHHATLRELVEVLNDCVVKSARNEKYITFFIALINRRTNMMQYINAGHNPPFICHNGQFSLLEQGTTGLGMFEKLPFITEGMVQFRPGSVLCCYTDGIVELENDKGESLGLDRLQSFYSSLTPSFSMSDLHGMIVEELDRYRGTTHYVDDLTLLSCRIK